MSQPPAPDRSAVDLAALRDALGDALARPGSDAYEQATSPENTSVEQAPAAVLAPQDAGQAAAAVAAAIAAGATVAVQATGHGSGRPLGPADVLLDTGGLDRVSIDPEAGTATVGAGVVWSAVQAAASEAGLLGLSGTAPDVGVAGYTFAGGVGWLTRPHGLASAQLRSVRYLDGAGRERLAAPDATDRLDRDALWAFRGGAPVGIATELTFGLATVGELAAGYLLWPAPDAAAVAALIAAWAGAVATATDTLTSTLAVLALPPEGPFPDELLGTPVLHLSYASPAGAGDLAQVGDAMRAVAPPAQDTSGPCDAARLATIHLDPPVPVPALGDGRWLSADAASVAPALLDPGRLGDGGLNMVELRHVATAAGGGDGAMTTPPGPFVFHGVGSAPDAGTRSATSAALEKLAEAARPADIGRAAPSFRDGQPDAGDARPAAERTRLRRTLDALDPERRLRFERGLGEPG